MLSEVIADLRAGDRGYRVIQQLPGIGPVLAAVIEAEIGDVRRFKTSAQLCCWAGLTLRHRPRDPATAGACEGMTAASGTARTDTPGH
jgi:transposase